MLPPNVLTPLVPISAASLTSAVTDIATQPTSGTLPTVVPNDYNIGHTLEYQ